MNRVYLLIHQTKENEDRGKGRLKKCLILLVFLLIIPVLTAGAHTTQSGQRTDQSNYNPSVNAPEYPEHGHYDPLVANGSHWETWRNATWDYGFYGNFSCDGRGITFFICNSTSYAKFLANQSCTSLVLYQYEPHRSKGNFTFVQPTVDNWSFVFNNTDNQFPAQCHLDLYEDLIFPNLTATLNGSFRRITFSSLWASLQVPGFVTGDLSINATVISEFYSILEIFLMTRNNAGLSGAMALGANSCKALSMAFTWDSRNAPNGNNTLWVFCRLANTTIMPYIAFTLDIENPLSPSQVVAVIAVCTIVLYGIMVVARVLWRRRQN